VGGETQGFEIFQRAGQLCPPNKTVLPRLPKNKEHWGGHPSSGRIPLGPPSFGPRAPIPRLGPRTRGTLHPTKRVCFCKSPQPQHHPKPNLEPGVRKLTRTSQGWVNTKCSPRGVGVAVRQKGKGKPGETKFQGGVRVGEKRTTAGDTVRKRGGFGWR